ncbi:hypothetical protein UY3_07958 [Chelonia mydas]|uniref:Uncharacterized protein n=1 Tax=Chelonia mydas TaxID=8469 RepID=M7BCM6_CHEMY|nr:hypothetical protein UY3_07958 [Chelonia mydas]
MPKSPGFKPCRSCSKPMPMGDLHDSCLKCLGKADEDEKCRICKGFHPRTKKEWDFNLKQLLMEVALSPHPPSACQDLAPSASVRTTPVAVVEVAPWLDSDRDPQHFCSPALQPVTSAWHPSHSPGQKRHQKPEKGCGSSSISRSLPIDICAHQDRLRRVARNTNLQTEELRITNQQAHLSHYNFNFWNSMLKFKELVPLESREEFGALVDEDKTVARTSLQALLDAEDLAARMLSSRIAMRHASGLPPEVQQMLQDLPFDRGDLFSEQTDFRLRSLKDSRTTLKSLGIVIQHGQRAAGEY